MRLHPRPRLSVGKIGVIEDASSYALASKSALQHRYTRCDRGCLQLCTCIQEHAPIWINRTGWTPPAMHLHPRGKRTPPAMPLYPRASLELLEHTPQLHKSLPGEHKPQEGHTRCSSSSLNKRSTIKIPFKKRSW